MARCLSPGLSAHCTQEQMLRLLQAWDPLRTRPGLLDTASGLADDLRPQASQRHPTSRGFVFSGRQGRGEEGGMGGLHTWWQTWAIDMHLFPAQMIQPGCCWGWA